MMSDVLNSYTNGNYHVTICKDGTKVRESAPGSNQKAKHPESIDVKITDFCDMGCPYCHESSTTTGKHGDLKALLDTLRPLPAGVELAIGGGNPLSHPDLLPFLEKLRERGIIANLTVNQGHVPQYLKLIRFLLGSQLVYGLGISITDSRLSNVREILLESPNVVFHVIAGVNSTNILREISYLQGKPKTLILGYKTFGRGVEYAQKLDERVKDSIADWYRTVPSYLGKTHLSFDNLAIEQLNIRRLFTTEGWQKFYMGDDGQFTMYIDAVKKEFARTSRSAERVPLNDTDLITYFQDLQK